MSQAPTGEGTQGWVANQVGGQPGNQFCRPYRPAEFLDPVPLKLPLRAWESHYSCHAPLIPPLVPPSSHKLVLISNVTTSVMSPLFGLPATYLRVYTTKMDPTDLSIDESRVSDAIDYITSFPDAKVAKVARDFGISRSILRARLQGRTSTKGTKTPNTKLSQPEEKALCRYIDRLDRINLAVRPEFILDAANTILLEREKRTSSTRQGEGQDPIILTVNRQWVTRFLKRHGYTKKRQKKLHSDRQASEDLDRVRQYFDQLQQVVQDHGITPEGIWNMDETGFRIGVGKDQLIVTKRSRAHYFALPENRESATAIEAISAAGNVIPVFLILAGQVHMAQWYQVPELDLETAIHLSPTGYSNDEISLHWIRHFDQYSNKTSISAKRLLILDGHGSHHTKEFIQYCDDHQIIPFGLPSHLTHLLQPLDVVVFQPLKHYHAKALDLMVRDGLTNITKLEFLACIQGVRKQAFKRSTVISAFKKTGIYPFNPLPILQQLQDRQPQRTPTPPSSQGSSSQFNTPVTLRQINKVAAQVTDGLGDLEDLDPSTASNIDRFIRGALSLASELVQTKRDLARTRYAEQIARQRRAGRNSQLQNGGVLTVAQGRQMVQQRVEDEVVRAQRIINAAQLRDRTARKRWFEQAAKTARDWRLKGRLQRAEVIDLNGRRRLLLRGFIPGQHFRKR